MTPNFHENKKASTLYQVEDGWIEIGDGTPFYFTDPRPGSLSAETIATALARICRYGGHTKRFYSVAEHCILMADFVATQEWATPQDVLMALHHDDTEVIIGDLPRPIKATMPEFKKAEMVLDRFIAQEFDLHREFPSWLKEYDTRILVNERAEIMRPSSNDWGTDGMAPLPGLVFKHITGRFPSLIARQFLNIHYKWTQFNV